MARLLTPLVRRGLGLALCAAFLIPAGAGCGPGGGGGAGAPAAAQAASGRAPTAGPGLLAGAAVVDITPPPGTPLGGFGGTPRRVIDAVSVPLMLLAIGGTCFDPDPSTGATFFAPAQGTHDPIAARALVLTNGLKKIAIVKLDTIGSSRKMREDLVKFAGTLGIAPEDLVVCATHTHSGPAAVSEQRLWQLVAMDCFSDAVYRTLLRGAEDALRGADAALRPAEIGIGATVETNASENRRGRPGIFDPELGVVKVVEPGGAPICALFNFAVHGTCSGQSNMLFSADCMGEMERTIEAGLGGIAIFTNGAEGDVAPAHGGFGGAQIVGRIVGGDVIALWPRIATRPWVEIRTAFEDVPMPPPVFNAGCVPVPGTSKTICDFLPGFSLAIPLDPSWLSTTLPFQAIRIDDTVLAALPGEPITEIGWEIKARARAKGFGRGFVLGLANDHGSYFTTFAEYVRGEYEGQSTMYGPGTGQAVIDAADRVMDRVR
jgi:hypothetical protein